tara:strand:+ start:86 stop:700 length:615 start_codon:yes stop_codon:yes gene_type:complete
MEARFCQDEKAEFALSSMVSMIMILLFSSIIAGMSLMIIEQAFKGSKSQSIEQSETLSSVPYILSFEIQNIDLADNTNDQMYLTFKFPYTSDSIPDTSVKWVVFGDDGNTGFHATDNKLDYSSGDFDFATPITGNGFTQDAITEFEPGVYYHIVLELTSPGGNGDYDLKHDYAGTLVIAIEQGRTTEIDFFVPNGATSGFDLMS